MTASAAALARKDPRYASNAGCFSVARGEEGVVRRETAGEPRWAKGRSAQAKTLAAWRTPSRRQWLTCRRDPKWKARCAALGNAVVPACARAAFMHLVLGDSGRVTLPSTEGSPKEQATAVKLWMDHSETAMAAAIANEGLANAWRSCARLAAGGAAKPKGAKMKPAGVMLNGVIMELQPLALTFRGSCVARQACPREASRLSASAGRARASIKHDRSSRNPSGLNAVPHRATWAGASVRCSPKGRSTT